MNIKKKSIPVKMPVSAITRFREKKAKIERHIFIMSGKKVRIPMTRIYELASKEKIFLDSSDLMRLKKWKKY